MNMRRMVFLAASAAALLSRALLATAAEPNLGPSLSPMPCSARTIRASTLIGATVLDPQNQKLGQIKDVLLDAQTGRATFVVLDAVTSASDHAMVVVPYEALRAGFYPAQNRLLVALDLRPDQLRAAPRIQDNQWQMLENPQFLEQARSFYRVREYTVARPIDNATAPYPPVPRVVPPQRRYILPSEADWPQSLIDFSSE